jgi:fatty-acid peroxygenase
MSYAFAKGAWVFLDLYGTSHHPRIWHDPKTFDPDRFRRAPSAFEFVPQGAGDAALTHRCPGEEITVQLMKGDVTHLTSSMLYTVPDQDLSVDLSQIPAFAEEWICDHEPEGRYAG